MNCFYVSVVCLLLLVILTGCGKKEENVNVGAEIKAQSKVEVNPTKPDVAEVSKLIAQAKKVPAMPKIVLPLPGSELPAKSGIEPPKTQSKTTTPNPTKDRPTPSTFLTKEYFPQTGNERYLIRKQIGQNGEVKEAAFTAVFSGGEETSWLSNDPKVRGSIKHRQNGEYLEYLNPGKKDWMRFLKLGAKPGESWEYKYGEGIGRFTFNELIDLNGKSCAILEYQWLKDGTARIQTTNWHVKDIGIVRQRSKMSDEKGTWRETGDNLFEEWSGETASRYKALVDAAPGNQTENNPSGGTGAKKGYAQSVLDLDPTMLKERSIKFPKGAKPLYSAGSVADFIQSLALLSGSGVTCWTGEYDKKVQGTDPNVPGYTFRIDLDSISGLPKNIWESVYGPVTGATTREIARFPSGTETWDYWTIQCADDVVHLRGACTANTAFQAGRQKGTISANTLFISKSCAEEICQNPKSIDAKEYRFQYK